MTQEPTWQRRLVIGAIVFAVVLVVGYLLFVLTPWGQRHDEAAFVARYTMDRRIRRLADSLTDTVQISSIALVAIAVLACALLRGRVLAGFVIGIGWATAVCLAELFKWLLPRPIFMPSHRLMWLPDQSYPSGHVTVTTSAALAIVLLVPARWRPWAALGAGFVSAGYGGAVVVTGMHRPADALGAIALSGVLMSIAAVALSRVWGRRIENVSSSRLPMFACAIAAIVTAALWWLFATRRFPNMHGEELVIFATAISAAAFSMCAWFGAQTRVFDWGR
ncbi:MAG: phosphatase PAP2 family protein [Kofleriaceae bacterium]|nr:phosphatase PAP2 family protein [Kofleriaceae bacterium]